MPIFEYTALSETGQVKTGILDADTPRDVRERVTGGESLAEALSNHPHAFNDLYVNMVRAGEASGHLDEVLFRIGGYLQRQSKLRNKVVSALMYPIIMVCVGTLVVVVLM